MFPTPTCFDSPLIPQLHSKWAMWPCHPKCLWYEHIHHVSRSTHWAGAPSRLEGSKARTAPSHGGCCVCSSKGFPHTCRLFSWLSSSDFPREWAHQPGSHTCWGCPRPHVPGHPPAAPCLCTAVAEKAVPQAVCPASDGGFTAQLAVQVPGAPACSWGRCPQGWVVLEEL